VYRAWLRIRRSVGTDGWRSCCVLWHKALPCASERSSDGRATLPWQAEACPTYAAQPPRNGQTSDPKLGLGRRKRPCPTRLRFHDAGGLGQSAVPALAVRVVHRRPLGARHLALVESD